LRNATEILPFTLHAAIRNGDLCQHFRNRNGLPVMWIT
jgi:hypothetical protein